MKKWIWISILIIVTTVGGITIFTYTKAMKPIKEASSIAKEVAQEEAGLKEMNQFSVYNGEETYYVVEGKDNQKSDIIVWINEINKSIIVKKKEEGISKEQAVSILLKDQTPKKINSVKLGINKGIPVWEIYSHTDKNTVNYHHIDFETGEILLRMENI